MSKSLTTKIVNEKVKEDARTIYRAISKGVTSPHELSSLLHTANEWVDAIYFLTNHGYVERQIRVKGDDQVYRNRTDIPYRVSDEDLQSTYHIIKK